MKDKNTALFYILLGCSIAFSSCVNTDTKSNKKIDTPIEKADSTANYSALETPKTITDTCFWYIKLEALGFVDVKSIDPSIWVDLKYATTDNFMQKDVYGCLKRCYLQPDVAIRIKDSQAFLQTLDSSLSLKIFDGLRPRSVQQIMWDLLDMPLEEKTKFVSNPKNGSLHNFGAAVDITLVNKSTGEDLDMGTPYDYIGINAWPTKEAELLAKGVLTAEQIENRKLLRKVLKHASFINIQTEWWHFNACNRTKAYEIYTIVE